MKRTHVKRKGYLSDQLYSLVEDELNKGIMTMSLGDKSKWIHVMDAVDCGTVTPLEAYECLSLGYVAEYLLVRKSNYAHLI